MLSHSLIKVVILFQIFGPVYSKHLLKPLVLGAGNTKLLEIALRVLLLCNS